MGWLYLAGAIVLEVAGTTSMKYSQGMTRLGPTVLMFVLYLLAFALLSLSIRTIDLGVAYAIWAGIGTALIALVSVFLFGLHLSVWQIASIGLIIAGVVGLHLGGAHD